MSIDALRNGLGTLLSKAPVTATQGMRVLPADVARWPRTVYQDGEDIYCPLAYGTAFGGPYDRLDDGRTASGKSTKQPGGIIGCALPMPAARGCIGTPLPQLPWGTPVEITYQGRMVIVELIDEGPSGGLKSRANIDVTYEAWERLAGRDLEPSIVNTWGAIVSYRIRGVARFLIDYRPHIPEDDGFPNANRP